jgi:ACS family tartrate transporter-like MFS transporter
MTPRNDDLHGGCDALARKIRRHLLPLLFVLYIVSYLDRINVGFAALEMNRELGISSEQYGLLSGIFFWGYCLFEIPSNLILHRVGARWWIARILITWGVIALMTGFVQSVTQLYVARFFLGVAEAGFYPGVLYYLSYWFKQGQQAKTIAVFLTALPAASVVGGPLSGWLLDHARGFGFSSWRWLLILEALPAIVGGLITLRTLPDRPRHARFLTPDEATRIERELAVEARTKVGSSQVSVWKAVTHPRILQFMAIHFLYLMGLYVMSFWMPQSIKAVAQGYSNTTIGLLVLIPNAVSLPIMVLVSRHSEARNERYAHAAVSLVLAAVAMYFVGVAPSLGARVALWCVVAAGTASYLGPFWACPGEFVGGRSAASAFAFINSVGSLGSFFALSIVGAISKRTGSLQAGFQWIAAALLLAGGLMLAQKLYRSQAMPVSV